MNLINKKSFKVFYIKVSDKFHSQLKALASENCMTLTELVLKALKEYIENHYKEYIEND